MGSDYTGENYTQSDDDYDFEDAEEAEDSSDYDCSSSNTSSQSGYTTDGYYDDDEFTNTSSSSNTEPKYISVMDVMHFCNLCVAKMGISIADLNAVDCAQKTALDSLVAMGYTIK